MKLNIEKFKEHYEYKYVDDILYIISKSTNKRKAVFLNQVIYLFYGVDAPSNREGAERILKNIDKLERVGQAQKINVNDLYKDLLGFSDDELYLKINKYTRQSGDYISKLLKEINFIKNDISNDSIEDKFYIKELDPLHFYDIHNITRRLGLYKISEELYATQYLISSIDDYEYIQNYYSKEPNTEIFNRTEFILEIDMFLKDNFFIEGLEFINNTHWTELNLSLEDKFIALKNNKKKIMEK